MNGQIEPENFCVMSDPAKVTFRRTLWVLLALGLLYWVVFAIPNAQNAKDEHMLFLFSHDENMTYPIVVHMLAPVQRITALWGQLVVYGDYHYGYPFYFLSMLVVLPVRLIFGATYTEHTQLNLFLLRQLISVLPTLLAAGILVYLQTRFQSMLRSALLFGLVLASPGVVRSALNWWHPDALAILAVVLSIFFLDRDRLRLGRNFLLAAVCIGLAISIKLIGLFMGMAVAGYVIAAWWRQEHRLAGLRPVILKTLLFVVVMGLAAVITNPFLIYPGQREQLLRIQNEKQVELSQGYASDPNQRDYQKGPQFWAETLSGWYGVPAFLGLLGLSLTAGCLWGSQRLLNRLVLAWVVPYSIYLLWFVAVKPDHYWLPVMLPLFSAAFNLWDIVRSRGSRLAEGQQRRLLQGLVAGLLVVSIGLQVWQYAPHWVYSYSHVMDMEASFGY
jgi:hypothetical protein